MKKGKYVFSQILDFLDRNDFNYPEKIRCIIYWDEEQQRKFIFFTNALDISQMMVAELCHNRWQIELFFKWLKQHLKIKKFWGESENAMRIQIFTAITACCMMAIVQKKMGIDRPIYEMLQLASVSLTERMPLQQLFVKPNYKIVNELDGSREPTLFDCKTLYKPSGTFTGHTCWHNPYGLYPSFFGAPQNSLYHSATKGKAFHHPSLIQIKKRFDIYPSIQSFLKR